MTKKEKSFLKVMKIGSAQVKLFSRFRWFTFINGTGYELLRIKKKKGGKGYGFPEKGYEMWSNTWKSRRSLFVYLYGSVSIGGFRDERRQTEWIIDIRLSISNINRYILAFNPSFLEWKAVRRVLIRVCGCMCVCCKNKLDWTESFPRWDEKKIPFFVWTVNDLFLWKTPVIKDARKGSTFYNSHRKRTSAGKALLFVILNRFLWYLISWE